MYRLVGWLFDQLNRFSPVLIQTPQHRSFGNGAEEMFFGLLKAKRENKKVLFLYPRLVIFGKGLRIANRELFHLRSAYSASNDNLFSLVAGSLVTVYTLCLWFIDRLRGSRRLRGLLRLIWPRLPACAPSDNGYQVPRIGKTAIWKPQEADTFSWQAAERQRWSEQFEGYVPPRLGDDQLRLAEQIRLQMGIPLTDWFVCLHASESDPPTVRNASIQNYIPGIKAITAAGGWVVRLGDSKMACLPLMERVIDYGHTPHKSELMDLYLISQCRFFIGLASGPTFVATLFKKPQVAVNMTDWAMGLPLWKGSLTIIKHVFSRSRDRFLSLKEILEEPYQVQVFDLASEEYVLVENTPDEIREVIEEFLDAPTAHEYSSLQKTFNEGRKKQIRRWVEQGEPRWHGVLERDLFEGQYRLVSRIDAAATLGRRYLEKNWLVDELERTAANRPAKRRVQ